MSFNISSKMRMGPTCMWCDYVFFSSNVWGGFEMRLMTCLCLVCVERCNSVWKFAFPVLIFFDTTSFNEIESCTTSSLYNFCTKILDSQHRNLCKFLSRIFAINYYVPNYIIHLGKRILCRILS